MIGQPVDLVGCSASNFAGSADCLIENIQGYSTWIEQRISQARLA
jgi:hypothetical protein